MQCLSTTLSYDIEISAGSQVKQGVNREVNPFVFYDLSTGRKALLPPLFLLKQLGIINFNLSL